MEKVDNTYTISWGKMFHFFRPNEAPDFPLDMVGAQIINIGTAYGAHLEGGLVIDYKTKEGVTKRFLAGFTEIGMWEEDESGIVEGEKVNS